MLVEVTHNNQQRWISLPSDMTIEEAIKLLTEKVRLGEIFKQQIAEDQQ